MKRLDEMRSAEKRTEVRKQGNLGQQVASGAFVIQIGDVNGGSVNLQPAGATRPSETAPFAELQLTAGDRKQLTAVRQALSSLFSEGDLRDLVFDLGLDYDNLPGNSKYDKARELVAYCQRRARLPELITALVQRRPAVLEALNRDRSTN